MDQTPVCLKFDYLPGEQGATLLRCYGSTSALELPAKIDGLPLVALAPYAFSASQGAELALERVRETQQVCSAVICTSAIFSEDMLERPICGSRLETLTLPDSVHSIGEHAFYDCRTFRRLHATDRLGSIGDGAFKNCPALRELSLDLLDGHDGCVAPYLAELQDTVEVTLKNHLLAEDAQTVRLVFPEYFDDYEENTPARIIVWHECGSGFRYRQCFRDGGIDYAKYDALFPTAVIEDNTETIVKLALGRLLFPHALRRVHREQYLNFLREHAANTAALFLADDQAAMLETLASLGVLSPCALPELLRAASHADAPACRSFLLDYSHRCRPAQTKTFEL